ncbi:hypothetical protein AncyloWKF20_09415 [Ancylobacter sp. WKF20]|uniref:hypothetical protein n=1 Tax=Ancylobacter sp. WKF20 TaxID=3039801 RepID=UPI002434210C|nr:hypothetical protein [Ancylobacter sp. WKF20]WGD32012.1 hypothetical protein AncyloWKF20_09415 [Ancylobacter sp. WKF20]
MTFGEYLEWLFKIGTGWLGWPPAVVMGCTMRELRLAYDGKLDMLRAIHGGGEKPDPGLVSAKDGKGVRALMTSLGARKVRP